MPPRSDAAIDEIRFAERRGVRSSVDVHDLEPFQTNPAAHHGGLFGTGIGDDEIALMAASRARNRDYAHGFPPSAYSRGNWMDAKDPDGFPSSLAAFNDPRSQLDAPIYPFPSPSAYAPALPEPSPSPATFSAAHPSMNNAFPTQPQNMPFQGHRTSLAYPQNPHSLSSPTPRPPPSGISPIGPPQFANTVGVNSRSEPYHDMHHLQMESIHRPYAAFESYMQARNLPTAATSHEASHRASQSPIASQHEVSRNF